MSAPYDEAAEVLLASDFLPIPVAGKSQPIGGATGYDGTVTFEKVNRWLHSDLTVRAKAGRGHRMDNVGIRHQLTLAIDVDEGYGDKSGVSQLAQFAARAGLPPLPATWSSTARGDSSPSRQYLYRIPEDRPLKTKPCKAVELCNWHHRYTVCAPSIHPDTGAAYAWYLPGEAGVPPTWGERTTRYPRRDVLADLPAEWFEVFAAGVTVNADRTVDTVAVQEFLAAFEEGDPDGLVRHLIAKWAAPAQHVGHDEAKSALIHAFMLGRAGHVGVPRLVEVIYGRLVGYLEATPGRGKGEADRLLSATATIAQQKPEPERVEEAGFFQGGSYKIPKVVTALDDAATPEELAHFLSTFTRYGDPRRLGRRLTWAKGDAPGRLPFHARHLVTEALAGHYPARRALGALTEAYSHHGGTDAASPRILLGMALGDVLAQRISA